MPYNTIISSPAFKRPLPRLGSSRATAQQRYERKPCDAIVPRLRTTDQFHRSIDCSIARRENSSAGRTARIVTYNLRKTIAWRKAPYQVDACFSFLPDSPRYSRVIFSPFLSVRLSKRAKGNANAPLKNNRSRVNCNAAGVRSAE